MNCRRIEAYPAFGGGEGGIRTPDTVTRMPHFECGAFNHSATSPSLINLEILRLEASAEGHLLPLCYHFFLEAPIYSLSRGEVNAGGSIGLHSWQNVTIEVEGYCAQTNKLGPAPGRVPPKRRRPPGLVLGVRCVQR